MNIGEFIIKIGTQGDTKELEKAIKKLEDAEKKSRRLIKTKQALAKATDDEERALIKKNAAHGLRRRSRNQRKWRKHCAHQLPALLHLLRLRRRNHSVQGKKHLLCLPFADKRRKIIFF